MWTYLIIFLAALVFVLVFLHRVFLMGKKAEKKIVEEVPEEKADESVKLLKKDKSKAEALCEKGKQLVKAGKDEEAIKSFVQALAIDPNHADTQHELAMLYLNKQMYSSAAALFKQLAEALENPIHYSHLGFALYQQNQFEEAKNAYQQAIVLDPSRPQRFISLAQVYRSLKQPDLSIIAINKALELDKDNLDFLFLLAELHNDLQKIEDCKLVLKKILELDAENKEALSLLKKIELPPQE
jgi:tetratricopeptide (TPR) repeat protein